MSGELFNQTQFKATTPNAVAHVLRRSGMNTTTGKTNDGLEVSGRGRGVSVDAHAKQNAPEMAQKATYALSRKRYRVSHTEGSTHLQVTR